MKVGLTGGIACGKSTVAAMLTERGAILVDADRIAREVVEPGMPALARIAERFGAEMLLPDGRLDRKALGAKVFADSEARRDLEAILHPTIRATIRERMDTHEREEPNRLVVVDIPLLYESGLEPMFPEVIVVYVPEAVQLERLIGRDGLDREQAIKRIQSQMPIEEKRKRADIVIDNSGTMEETREQIERYLRERGMG